jgi:branched-chain amino acid transport system substrate-binding protein
MLRRHARWFGASVALLATGALMAGCGSSSDDSTSTTAASTPATSTPSTGSDTTATSGGDALGTPNKATGEPLVFAMINLETGPVTFPEARQGAEAAAEYVNNYLGGINGRPIKIESCSADGTPATSQRCANQLVEKHPVAVLGGGDTGASGAFPVWERAKLAYLGGLPLTPIESNAPNAVTFISIVVGDNAAMVKYAKDTLGVSSASIMETDDTQGKYTADIIANVMKNVGIETNRVPVTPGASDQSSQAASAIGSNPDMVYNETPGACPAALKALQSVGFSGKLAGIDSCSSPPAIAAAGSAAEGLYFAQPLLSPDADDPQAKLVGAALAKYGPKDMAVNTFALASFAAVMNIQDTLSKIDGDLTTDAILKAFRTGSDHPNFLAHPYTCDGKQVPAQSAVCNGFQKIKQVKDGKVVTVTDDWVDGAQYYKPPAAG